MMRILPTIIFLITITFSCTPNINDNQTFYNNGKLYSKKTNRPYSGEVSSQHKNGKIASRFNYKEGNPLGEWATFGFNGEVIQKGEFILDIELERFLNAQKEFQDYSLSLNEEGEYSSATLNIEVKFLGEIISDSSLDQIVETYLEKYEQDDYETSFYIKDSLILRKYYPSLSF